MSLPSLHASTSSCRLRLFPAGEAARAARKKGSKRVTFFIWPIREMGIRLENVCSARARGKKACWVYAQIPRCGVCPQSGRGYETTILRTLSRTGCKWGKNCDGVRLRSKFPHFPRETIGFHRLFRMDFWIVIVPRCFLSSPSFCIKKRKPGKYFLYS